MRPSNNTLGFPRIFLPYSMTAGGNCCENFIVGAGLSWRSCNFRSWIAFWKDVWYSSGESPKRFALLFRPAVRSPHRLVYLCGPIPLNLGTSSHVSHLLSFRLSRNKTESSPEILKF